MTIYNELKLGLTDEQIAVLEQVRELEKERDEYDDLAGIWLSARVKYAKQYRESGEEAHRKLRDHADDMYHKCDKLSYEATVLMDELDEYYRNL